MNRKTKGILLIIGAAIGFAGLNLFVKLSGDLPTFQKVFFRNLIAFIFSSVIVLRDKSTLSSVKGHVGGLLLRCFFGLSGVVCNFYAVDNMTDLADASLLNKLSPFFAIIFSIFILKEKVSKTEWAFVFVAFIGSLFVIKPSLTPEIIPGAVGLVGGMCAGLAYTIIRKLTSVGVNGSAIVFGFSGFSCVVILPLFIVNYQSMSTMQLIYLILAGCSATLGQFCITYAYKFAPAKEISVFDYTQIVFSCILGLLFFGTLPDVYSFIGYVIIVVVAVMRWRYDLKKV